MNSIVWLVFDSCRYDAVVAASTPNLDFLGRLERRFSYASWTYPSHAAMLIGLPPHKNPTETFAASVYQSEFEAWGRRTGAFDQLSFGDFVPRLSLATVLARLGYRTTAYVSLPVLNPQSGLARGFDEWRLWETHDDFAGMIEAMTFPDGEPQFYFLNVGETHYPYRMRGSELPRLHGVHGVARKLGAGEDAGGTSTPWFSADELARLQAKQVEAVTYLDTKLGELFSRAPADTWFLVTADHGELFGEGGQFGHGPVFDRKVFEVPFVEGPNPVGLARQ